MLTESAPRPIQSISCNVFEEGWYVVPSCIYFLSVFLLLFKKAYVNQITTKRFLREQFGKDFDLRTCDFVLEMALNCPIVWFLQTILVCIVGDIAGGGSMTDFLKVNSFAHSKYFLENFAHTKMLTTHKKPS